MEDFLFYHIEWTLIFTIIIKRNRVSYKTGLHDLLIILK